MEMHSPVIAKRLWNVLRLTFFMMEGIDIEEEVDHGHELDDEERKL